MIFSASHSLLGEHIVMLVANVFASNRPQAIILCHYGERWLIWDSSAVFCESYIITLRPRNNGRHFPDIFKYIFLNENVWISIDFSLFVPKGQINNIPALVQIMAWRRPGDKPLCEPMMVSLLTHTCVTRPQRVNHISCNIALILISRGRVVDRLLVALLLSQLGDKALYTN